MTNRREFLGLSAGAMLATGAVGAQDAERASRPKMTLMLGGTGFLGPQAVTAAIRRGHKVTLFHRGRTRPGLFPDPEELHGDRDKDDLKALEGRRWDAVVEAAWTARAGKP